PCDTDPSEKDQLPCRPPPQHEGDGDNGQRRRACTNQEVSRLVQALRRGHQGRDASRPRRGGGTAAPHSLDQGKRLTAICCERSGIHARGASGGSGGCAASTPQLNDDRSGIHSRGASGGSGGCAASTPQTQRGSLDTFRRALIVSNCTSCLCSGVRRRPATVARSLVVGAQVTWR